MARSAAPLLLLSLLLLFAFESISAKPARPAGDVNKADASVTAKPFEMNAAAAGAQGGYDAGSYYKTDKGHYDMPYGEDDECPNPQTADTVNNGEQSTTCIAHRRPLGSAWLRNRYHTDNQRFKGGCVASGGVVGGCQCIQQVTTFHPWSWVITR